MAEQVLRIIPLGGLGEVGRNMMVYQYGDEYLVVDAGLMFPESSMLGVDYIIPDIQFYFFRVTVKRLTPSPGPHALRVENISRVHRRHGHSRKELQFFLAHSLKV